MPGGGRAGRGGAPLPRPPAHGQGRLPGAEGKRGAQQRGHATGGSRRGSMIVPRPLLGAVLLLLASLVLSKGGRRCGVVEILRQYQAVLFDEIHNLKNLSGPAEAHRKHRSRAGPACRSNQEQKILLSIYNMSMSLRAVASGSLHDSRELAAMKVASNTESVIRQHCRKIHKARQRSPPRPPAQGKQQPRGEGSRRKRQKELARMAESLLICWEKLYSLHSWG